MTKPTDDIRPYRPYSGPLTLLQLLGVIAVVGAVLSAIVYCFFA